jgi:hypothetical protein
MTLQHYEVERLLKDLATLAIRDYGVMARWVSSKMGRDHIAIGDCRIYMRGSLYEIKQKGHPAVTRVKPDEVLRFAIKPMTESPPLF